MTTRLPETATDRRVGIILDLDLRPIALKMGSTDEVRAFIGQRMDASKVGAFYSGPATHCPACSEPTLVTDRGSTPEFVVPEPGGRRCLNCDWDGHCPNCRVELDTEEAYCSEACEWEHRADELYTSGRLP